MQTKTLLTQNIVPPQWVKNSMKNSLSHNLSKISEYSKHTNTLQKAELSHCDICEQSSLSIQSESEDLYDSLYKDRYGPTNIPLHFAVSHSQFFSFPMSPFTMYYYDETAPNNVLLLNDLEDEPPTIPFLRTLIEKLTEKKKDPEIEPKEQIYSDVISFEDINLNEESPSEFASSECSFGKTETYNDVACCKCSVTASETNLTYTNATHQTPNISNGQLSSNCASAILRNLKPIDFTPFTQQSTYALTPPSQCMYCHGTKLYNHIQTIGDCHIQTKKPCYFCSENEYNADIGAVAPPITNNNYIYYTNNQNISKTEAISKSLERKNEIAFEPKKSYIEYTNSPLIENPAYDTPSQEEYESNKFEKNLKETQKFSFSVSSLSKNQKIMDADSQSLIEKRSKASVEILPNTFLVADSNIYSKSSVTDNNSNGEENPDSVLYQKHKLFFDTNQFPNCNNLSHYEYSYSVSYKHYPVIFYDALTQLPSNTLIES